MSGFTRTDFHQRIDTIQQDMKELEKFHWMSADKWSIIRLHHCRKTGLSAFPDQEPAHHENSSLFTA